MNDRPTRIQRSRLAGWRMPAGAIYVGRPTRWGNPWRIGLARCGCRSVGECSHNMFRTETAEEAVEIYRDWLARWVGRERKLAVLRGRTLVCWCPLDRPCHADVLLELANA